MTSKKIPFSFIFVQFMAKFTFFTDFPTHCCQAITCALGTLFGNHNANSAIIKTPLSALSGKFVPKTWNSFHFWLFC